MARHRRFRRGHIAVILIALSAVTAQAQEGPELFSGGISSEFGFTLGEAVDTKRSKLPAPKPQDNGNLYFVMKLAKPAGPFEQVVVGLSPKSQRVLTLRARKDFATPAACQAVLEQLSTDMKSRMGVTPRRSVEAAGSWVFYNVEQEPVAREMSCNDKRLDFYVFDKKLILQGVTESLEIAQQASATPAAQR